VSLIVSGTKFFQIFTKAVQAVQAVHIRLEATLARSEHTGLGTSERGRESA
jgi:hypothetical protein